MKAVRISADNAALAGFVGTNHCSYWRPGPRGVAGAWSRTGTGRLHQLWTPLT